MQSELLRTEDNWQAIRCDWDRLAGGNPMLSFDWLYAWWRAYGEGSRLHIVIVRDAAQRIVGIAPWYQSDPILSPAVRFLGSGKVCSDYLSVMSDADCSAAVHQEIVAHARRQFGRFGSSAFARGLCLEGPSESDPATVQLLSSFQQAGFLLKTKKLESCWQISLPETWEAMLLKLKKSFRRKARKCMDRLNDGSLKSYDVTSPNDWPSALEILEKLHQARRASMGETGCFDDPRFAKFLNRAIPPMLTQRRARVIWIESAGKPIAVQLQLIGDTFVGMYQSGIDPASRELEPGHVLIARAIGQAIHEGFKTFDFLRGDEHYKSAWSAQPAGLVRAWLIPPTIWARSVHYAGEGAWALRAAYRQFRQSNPRELAKSDQEADDKLQAAAQNLD